MNYYELHIGDYDKATAHLTACEDGVYGRLLRRYYDTEQPLPLDVKALQRFVRARTREEQQAVVTILEEFFQKQEDGWHHKRCDVEIARYQQKSQKARESVSKRWCKRSTDEVQTASDDDTNVHTNVLRTQCEGNTPRARPQTPDTRHQTPVHTNPTDSSVYPLPSVEGSGTAKNADPPSPPPDFDGQNAEILNGKSVVRISANFELPEEWGLSAEALGWKPSEVIFQAEKYRQYWTVGKGQGTRRNVKGWRQTWSNWLEKAARDKR